jgi:lipopolysaccharide exporter
MNSVRRALALSMMERYLLLVLALASNMLIARWLTPEEIGLFSVTLAVIGLAQMLRDFGVGSFLIQHADLQDRHIKTAFGVMLILGVVLFAVFFAIAPLAANFYGDGRITDALRICALNFLVLPFCSISMSLFRREMSFGPITKVNLSAGVVGTSTTLALVWFDFGPQGLAIGSVVTNVVSGLVTAWLRRDPRVFQPSLSEWRAVLGFGGQSALTNVVGSAAVDINDLVLAKVLGFAPVAIMSRAQGLPNMFHRDLMGAVQGVAFPAFARAKRDGENVDAKWAGAVGYVTVFGWPFYGFMALLSLEIVRLMFGTQWDESARLVPVLCMACAVQALSSLVNLVLVAVGRVDLNTKVELGFNPFRVAVICITAVITESLTACAVALLVTAVVQVPVLFWVKSRCVPFDWRVLWVNLRMSGSVSLVTLLPPAAVVWWFGWARTEPVPLLVWLSAALASALLWLASVVALRHPVASEPAFVQLLQRLKRLTGLTPRSTDS